MFYFYILITIFKESILSIHIFIVKSILNILNIKLFLHPFYLRSLKQYIQDSFLYKYHKHLKYDVLCVCEEGIFSIFYLLYIWRISQYIMYIYYMNRILTYVYFVIIRDIYFYGRLWSAELERSQSWCLEMVSPLILVFSQKIIIFLTRYTA